MKMVFYKTVEDDNSILYTNPFNYNFVVEFDGKEYKVNEYLGYENYIFGSCDIIDVITYNKIKIMKKLKLELERIKEDLFRDKPFYFEIDINL